MTSYLHADYWSFGLDAEVAYKCVPVGCLLGASPWHLEPFAGLQLSARPLILALLHSTLCIS